MEVCGMNKPDFKSMNQKDLHSYVLAHREDQEAFYAYVDKLHAEATWIDMPPIQSAEELDNYPDFLEHLRQKSESSDKTV
jgi:hypothetical protein